MMEAAHCYEGTVNQVMGDGLRLTRQEFPLNDVEILFKELEPPDASSRPARPSCVNCVV